MLKEFSQRDEQRPPGMDYHGQHDSAWPNFSPPTPSTPPPMFDSISGERFANLMEKARQLDPDKFFDIDPQEFERITAGLRRSSDDGEERKDPVTTPIAPQSPPPAATTTATDASATSATSARPATSTTTVASAVPPASEACAVSDDKPSTAKPTASPQESRKDTIRAIMESIRPLTKDEVLDKLRAELPQQYYQQQESGNTRQDLLPLLKEAEKKHTLFTLVTIPNLFEKLMEDGHAAVAEALVDELLVDEAQPTSKKQYGLWCIQLFTSPVFYRHTLWPQQLRVVQAAVSPNFSWPRDRQKILTLFLNLSKEQAAQMPGPNLDVEQLAKVRYLWHEMESSMLPCLVPFLPNTCRHWSVKLLELPGLVTSKPNLGEHTMASITLKSRELPYNAEDICTRLAALAGDLFPDQFGPDNIYGIHVAIADRTPYSPSPGITVYPHKHYAIQPASKDWWSLPMVDILEALIRYCSKTLPVDEKAFCLSRTHAMAILDRYSGCHNTTKTKLDAMRAEAEKPHGSYSELMAFW